MTKLVYCLEKLFQAYLGRFPVVYYPIYALLKRNARQVVSEKTDIVIEGFPRSGNSFAVVSLKRSQNKPISVASHLHVAAQLVRAKRLNKPLVLLIREPLAAVSSLVIRDPVGINLALRYYIQYYRSALKAIDYPVVVEFSEMIQCYPRVIQSVNDKFGTSFQLPHSSDAWTQGIFEAIDSNYKRVTSGQDVDLATSSPNTKKEPHKQLIEKTIKDRHPELLAQACEIYHSVLNRRLEQW